MQRFNASFLTLWSGADQTISPDPFYPPSRPCATGGSSAPLSDCPCPCADRNFAHKAQQLLAGAEIEMTRALAAAARAGKLPSTAYAAVGSDNDQRFNVISGGGSIITNWFPFGLYVELAETNWDHFAYGGLRLSARARRTARCRRRRPPLDLGRSATAPTQHHLRCDCRALLLCSSVW